jgi:hypothetical protein
MRDVGHNKKNMTSENSQNELKKLGFKMTDFGYYGIYRHEIFENEDLRFVVSMDRCFFESYIYPKISNQTGGSILEIARKSLNDNNYLSEDLKDVPSHSIFEPNRCVRILVDNYEKIINYLQED